MIQLPQLKTTRTRVFHALSGIRPWGLALLLLTACGDLERRKQDSSESKEAGGRDSSDGGLSLFRLAKADLPTCNDDYEGALAYVQQEEAFYHCASGKWVGISIQGSKGESGSNGENGTAGQKGDTGEPAGGRVFHSGLADPIGFFLGFGSQTTARSLWVMFSDSAFVLLKEIDGEFDPVGQVGYSSDNANYVAMALA